ncbi:hypothetical protein SLE2022_265340 [Rubroshorea leprosula]|uniref:Epidermal patterning factor-like protein n=1 Tax=Rubroshorea leprosula TaxID=152421 RepID=A0AAV5J290_9ROSI|nr:hypothetical protein SLEP1_g18205 [Rubroshorea leprosula]
MASSRKSPIGLKILVTLMLILFSFFPFKSVGSVFGRGKPMKMVLGSRPPMCVNKCLSCRPCMAALVTPPHHQIDLRRYQGDESYYLLAWKCKCGDKFYQP